MKLRTLSLIAAALLLPLFVVACNSSGSVNTSKGSVSAGVAASVSPGFALPSVALPSGIASNLPALPANGNKLTTGQATVNLEGMSQGLNMNLGPLAVVAPGSGFALTFTDSQSDALAIAAKGSVPTGTSRTSPSFVVTVAAGSAKTAFASTSGQCTVSLTQVTATNVTGTFFCVSVPATGGKTINANGTFQATR